MAELQERAKSTREVQLTAALEAQADADMANIQGPIHALMMHGGLNMLVESAKMLSVADLKGALAACRQFRRMLPEAVRTLDGFDPRTMTDKTASAMAKTFTKVKVIDFRGCEKLSDACIRTVAEHCHGIVDLNIE